jgi:DNA-binding NtrC family response regulator
VQDGRSVAGMLNDISIPVVHAGDLAEAATKLRSDRFGVVLSEANLEDGTWLNVLELTRARGIELVVTDPFADAQFWSKAINLGAYDVLAQPFHRTEVRRVLASASRPMSLAIRAAAS